LSNFDSKVQTTDVLSLGEKFIFALSNFASKAKNLSFLRFFRTLPGEKFLSARHPSLKNFKYSPVNFAKKSR
jgi:hypothetical protein